MTSNAQDDGRFDAVSNTRESVVQVQLVRAGSPEHLAMLARGPASQPARQRNGVAGNPSEADARRAEEFPALNRALIAFGEPGLDAPAQAEAESPVSHATPGRRKSKRAAARDSGILGSLYP